MGTKKVAYTTLLKEALSDNVSEFDTTKTIDATGPMTKQILSYKGDGELKTTSDAASVLERYYFKDTDLGVEQIGEGQLGNELDAEPSDNINKTKKDMEKDIVEAEEVEDPEEEVEESVKEGDELSEAEEAVIERLISEMEGEEDEDEESEEDDDEDKKPVKEAKKAKKAVKEEEIEADEELDVDDEMGDAGEEDVEESVKEANLGPLGHPNDAESYENLEEAFKIFREEIEEDSVDIDDDEDVQV